MPPDHINNNNLVDTDDTFIQEAIAILLSQFESHRKSLRSLHYEKMGQFRRNRSIKTDPPMSIFRCHGCGKAFQARTMMYIIQSLIASNRLVSSSANDISGDFHNTQPTQNYNTNDQTHYMQPLLDMIQRLSNELASSPRRDSRLMSLVAQLQGWTTLQPMNTNQPNHSKDDSHFSSKNFPTLPSQTS